MTTAKFTLGALYCQDQGTDAEGDRFCLWARVSKITAKRVEFEFLEQRGLFATEPVVPFQTKRVMNSKNDYVWHLYCDRQLYEDNNDVTEVHLNVSLERYNPFVLKRVHG